MGKIQILRNCLTVCGAIFTPATLFEKASGVLMDGYVWVGLAFVCLLVGLLWSMHEQIAQVKEQAERQFFQVNPDYRDYKYFWELYGLYNHGKKLADTMSESKFIHWRGDIRICLERWGETKNCDFGLNLPPHATVNDYLQKLEDMLQDNAKTVSF